MNSKGLFFLSVLFLTAFLSHAQKQGLYPLTQYSVGGTGSNAQLRTTAVQNDTLKIPYIEDFSGPGLPIDSMTVDTLPGLELVYRITHLKMHALKSGDSIKVYNASSKNTSVNNLLNGLKYVQVINKYAFQLFNDKALTIPATVVAQRVHYLNWHYLGRGGYSTTPDVLGFLNNNGGVFINNDMAVNPISIGVASFDGVDFKGTPYSTSTTKGYSDKLTSLPFNLSGYNSGSNIYMSFYWQVKGMGDSPLASEFLSLEFFTAAGTWVEVWRKYGDNVQDTFKVAMIPITDIAYLHEGFRYQFRSYGALNGRFNVWNVDYIYIDKNRTAAYQNIKDVSIISTSRTALLNYTSVPYKHIKDLPISAVTSETGPAFMKIRDSLNIERRDPITDEILLRDFAIERQHLVRDNRGNESIKYERRQLRDIQSFVFTQTFTDTIVGHLMTAPYVLKEEFFYQPLDTLGAIDMSFNNFAAIETYFTDYYSYDDGIPEVTYLSVNNGGTRTAVGYKILKEDTLTHIDFCFLKNNGSDLTNSAMFMNVWKRDSTAGVGPSDPFKLSQMASQQIAIKYSTTINGYTRYAFTTPLKLDSGKTYYFGYTQNFNNALFLGYDRNNDRLDKIFFCNDAINWQPFTDITTEPGALMIRPVFSNNEIVTDTRDELTQQNQFTIYPNPAKSELHFTGEPEYISIYDVSGRLLVEKQIEGQETISTEILSNGLYLIILSKADYKEVKRLIIQK